MLKKRNIGRDVTDFHENPPTPRNLPSLTVTKSVYPPPPPLRDVINGWPLTHKSISTVYPIFTYLIYSKERRGSHLIFEIIFRTL